MTDVDVAFKKWKSERREKNEMIGAGQASEFVLETMAAMTKLYLHFE